MIVPNIGARDAKGWSVFSVDPGETSGWAWSCLGRTEVGRQGVETSMRLARRAQGGLLASDARSLWGQLRVDDPDTYTSEAQAMESLWSTALMCGEMGARTSEGAVPELTDLVIEDFILHERTSERNLLSPVRLTAQLILLAHQDPHWLRLHLSPPSAKAVINDERLRRWDLYVKGGHARDAMRHLIVQLRTLSG